MSFDPATALFDLVKTGIDKAFPDKTEAAKFCKNWSGGFRYYSENNFIHTDIGPKRRWR